MTIAHQPKNSIVLLQGLVAFDSEKQDESEAEVGGFAIKRVLGEEEMEVVGGGGEVERRMGRRTGRRAVERRRRRRRRKGIGRKRGEASSAVGEEERVME